MSIAARAQSVLTPNRSLHSALEGPTKLSRRQNHKIEIAGWIEHIRRNDNISLALSKHVELRPTHDSTALGNQVPVF